MPRHLQPRLLQRRHHVLAVANLSGFHALLEVGPEQLARVRLDREAGPQLRRVDVRLVRARLQRPRALRIVRAAPAVLVVQCVAQRVEALLPARRRDVQAPARLQVAARGQHVDMDPAVVLAVQHRRPGVAVRIQPGPGRLLELVQRPPDLAGARRVLRCPGDHA